MGSKESLPPEFLGFRDVPLFGSEGQAIPNQPIVVHLNMEEQLSKDLEMKQAQTALPPSDPSLA